MHQADGDGAPGASYAIGVDIGGTKIAAGLVNLGDGAVVMAGSTVAGVIAAREAGAHRVELCASLIEGGTTPSLGMIKRARQVEGIGLDFVRTPDNLYLLNQHGFPANKVLGAGVVNGRNIWRINLEETFSLLEEIASRVDPDRIWVQPSCSLLHLPHDVELETGLDAEIKPLLAFAEQRLTEIATLTRGLNEGRDAIRMMGRVLTGLDQIDKELQQKPPHKLLGTASLHASLIEGGRELSSYPDRCHLQMERRTIPGEAPGAAAREVDAVLAKLRSQDPDFKASAKVMFARSPYELAGDHDLPKAMLKASGSTNHSSERPVSRCSRHMIGSSSKKPTLNSTGMPTR